MGFKMVNIFNYGFAFPQNLPTCKISGWVKKSWDKLTFFVAPDIRKLSSTIESVNFEQVYRGLVQFYN